HGRNLTHIDLDNLDVALDDFAALASAANLHELCELDVGQVYAEGEGTLQVLACFIDAPLTRQLTRFVVRTFFPIPPDDLRRLLRSLTPGRLRCLRLGNCGLGDEGARALAEAPELAGLRELVLFENGVGPAGAEALARSPHLAGLTDLDLASNPVGSAGAAALASSVHLHDLRTLNLRQCDVGTP